MSVSNIRAFDLKTGNPIRDKIFITSRICYDAAHRRRRLSSYSSVSNSLLSSYLIIISLLCIVFASELTPFAISLANSVTIAISILLIVFALVERVRQTDTAAEHLEQLARKLNKLYSKIEVDAATGCLDVAKYEKYSLQYSQILDATPTRHLPFDFHIFRTENKNLFPEIKYFFLQPLMIRTSWVVRVYGLYFVTIFGFPILLCVAVGELWPHLVLSDDTGTSGFKSALQ